MTMRMPPLPHDLARYVRSEAELDELLAYVERSSLPPDEPVASPAAFAPQDEPTKDRLDVDSIVTKLASDPAPAGMSNVRMAPDLSRPPPRLDFDAVMGSLSLIPLAEIPDLPASLPNEPRIGVGELGWTGVLGIAMAAFALGSLLTQGLVP